jgi:drug/metabolite transporter (DMT)-like permease
VSSPVRGRIDATTITLTLLALVAFASNSLLTRLALGSQQIDAASFTAIRLLSGAVVLALLARAQAGSWAPMRGRGAAGPLALFLYAAPFSFAYLRIGAAVGALVLFGVVQLTMIGYGVARGERPSPIAWAGLVMAATGLAILTVPSVARPDPLGVALMAVAGVAWGIYSLAGRASTNALATNARSFLWSSPLALALIALAPGASAASARGIVLGVVSGGVTSGLGYAIWYRALPKLTVTQAAVAQLSVPIIAALGAALVLGERLTPRLGVAGVAVLGGVALVLVSRARSGAIRPTSAPAAGGR